MFYNNAQSYSDYLDFESRSREIPSFRINERSLVVLWAVCSFVCYLYTIICGVKANLLPPSWETNVQQAASSDVFGGL